MSVGERGVLVLIGAFVEPPGSRLTGSIPRSDRVERIPIQRVSDDTAA